MPDLSAQTLSTGFNSPAAVRHRNLRHLKDVITRHLMTAGGISVIIAIVMIAIYLVWVVIPLFFPARLQQLASYPIPSSRGDQSLYYAMEEQREIGMRVADNGHLVFFNIVTGEIMLEEALLEDTEVSVTSFSSGDPSTRLIAFGLENGQVQLAYHSYSVSFPDDVRVITPLVTTPFENGRLQIDNRGEAIVKLAVQSMVIFLRYY
jgi:phosphate transport system permease protein